MRNTGVWTLSIYFLFNILNGIDAGDYGKSSAAPPNPKPAPPNPKPAPPNTKPAPSKEVEIPPYGDFKDDIDRAGDTSKACRYDEPFWSDCDAFELKRYRVLHLIHGGRQCEEVKNITKHCTPGEFPPGTTWLISEHRKCIAELTRLKAMIADLAKYIEALHGKGKILFDAYLGLKKHLDELKQTIQSLQTEDQQKKTTIANVREEIETWKGKARELQAELDELRTKYHDLQAEHKEGGEKLKECFSDKSRCLSENDRLKKKIHDEEAENSEIKRRLLEAAKYKEQLKEVKFAIAKFEYKVEKLQENLEKVKEKLSDCRLDLMFFEHKEVIEDSKDTKVDMNMEMWIIHNKSNSKHEETLFTMPTTEKPKETNIKKEAKCLITYYGYTNESCWYQTKGQSSEYEYADSMGHHLVEAHWKYFTIDVANQYDCDRAAQLHYEFLLNRCSPKHYLPVMSVYRPNGQLKELPTHIYPKPNIPQPGHPYRCWITFLGPHGHCERHMDRYDLYNVDDGQDGYMGASQSKNTCLDRGAWWTKYCENPAISTYVPEGVSSNWKNEDIQHDSHGAKMFENYKAMTNKINPESINPNDLHRPSQELPEEYEDTPEYRKSLHLKGKEREEILESLRKRLGMTRKDSYKQVKWHGGEPPPLNTGGNKSSSSSSTSKSSASSGSSSSSAMSSSNKDSHTSESEKSSSSSLKSGSSSSLDKGSSSLSGSISSSSSGASSSDSKSAIKSSSFGSFSGSSSGGY
nr:mucin-like spermatophore wall protein 1 [Lepeophtheirus salmonis]